LSFKYTTISAWPLAVARALNASGIDANQVFDNAGLSLSKLEMSPDSRVAIETMTRFWQIVEKETRLTSFGLKVGVYAYPLHFHTLGLLMISSNTLAQAFEKIPTYYAMVSNSASIKLQHTPQQLGFTITPLEGVKISALPIDAFFSSLMHHGCLMIGHKRFVKHVALMRDKPANVEPWEACFGCTVSFNQPENCLWMDRSMLEEASITGNTQLAIHNEQSVREYLNNMQALSWREKTSQGIHAMLVVGEPTLLQAAQMYNLSERSLSRYLHQEGTNFRELLQQKRQELAQHYLQNTSIPIIDIADKLGYTNPNNFTRVFRSWFGLSPTRYRSQSESSD